MTIWWRDIPTQVNAQQGRDRYRAVLPRRFQRAVDEAAMAAGLTHATDYVAEWRRETTPLAADLDAAALQTAADAAAASFDGDYSKERLTAIARNSGYEPENGT